MKYDHNKPGTTFYGADPRGVNYEQDGHAFDAGYEYLGTCDPQGNIILAADSKSKRRPEAAKVEVGTE